jgi:hypothetical protein
MVNVYIWSAIITLALLILFSYIDRNKSLTVGDVLYSSIACMIPIVNVAVVLFFIWHMKDKVLISNDPD